MIKTDDKRSKGLQQFVVVFIPVTIGPPLRKVIDAVVADQPLNDFQQTFGVGILDLLAVAIQELSPHVLFLCKSHEEFDEAGPRHELIRVSKLLAFFGKARYELDLVEGLGQLLRDVAELPSEVHG